MSINRLYFSRIVKILPTAINVMEPSDGVQELDIADGIKQLLTDADFTIESIIDLGYQEVSETLHIDPYVGKLIVEAAQDIVQDIALKYAGIDKNSLIDMNDSGMSFDEIADYLDKFGSSRYG